MECRLCGAPTDSALCRFCQYEARQAAPATQVQTESHLRCRQCGIQIEEHPGLPPLCQVCGALLLVVSKSGWLITAQAEWDRENIALARKKLELLNRRGPLAA